MKLKSILIWGCVAYAATAFAGSVDSDGYPIMYLRGNLNGWSAPKEHQFNRNGRVYSLDIDKLEGEFKVSNDDWSFNYGADQSNVYTDNDTQYTAYPDGANFHSSIQGRTTISFVYEESGTSIILFSSDGKVLTATEKANHSNTLPLLYINVRDENGNLNNEIISKDLDHKNYFSGEYWLDINGCEWAEEAGFKSLGSADEPLKLEIKARGNWTRIGFSKKPFKLKLDKKQSMLGMSKSKHYAILAHADDNKGYLRNFVGFNIGKRIGLPWTPSQQPIEVYINGDYRGVYFLTESIRIGDDRVMIEELKDNETDPALVSGGYLVELDNYDEENQIRMEEKGCIDNYRDLLRVTFDTPEFYSEIQRQFIRDQFSAMNDLVGANSDDLWRYLDIDDAARYYLVEEIISHIEAFHGSTYLYRDRGENQKWHFSPLWDCGNAFNGPTDGFFYNNSPFGSTWIPSMRQNQKFNEKVKETWLWFMSNCFDGIYDDIESYCASLESAAKYDNRRWKDQPTPWNGSGVADNSDIHSRKNQVVYHLKEKINWLKNQFGDYTRGVFAESERDTTPAVELPDYLEVSVDQLTDSTLGETEIYSITGQKVSKPAAGQICIVKNNGRTYKVIVK